MKSPHYQADGTTLTSPTVVGDEVGSVIGVNMKLTRNDKEAPARINLGKRLAVSISIWIHGKAPSHLQMFNAQIDLRVCIFVRQIIACLHEHDYKNTKNADNVAMNYPRPCVAQQH